MIHIACNIDSRYVRHCAVTLVSLFENNPSEEFTVHILDGGLNQQEQETLSQLAQRYCHTVRYYSPQPDMLKGLSIHKFGKRISMATYYRCILADILPPGIEKVLYLDCDIVVRGNIRPFWDTPLDGRTGVAAVEDIGCGETRRYEILNYPMKDSYFNAGVLLINLTFWRGHQVGKACIEYFRKYPERILFNDQDLLNSILHAHKSLVDLRWNVQDGFYRTPPGGLTSGWREKYADVLKHPAILHYTNRKPWDYDSQHPLRMEYFKYLDLTPWKGERPWNDLSNRLKRMFYLIPFRLRVRRPKYVDLNSF